MKSKKPSLEPMYAAIREGMACPEWTWPSHGPRAPLDFTPRVQTDDEKVTEYLNVCRGLGIPEASLSAAEAWFREHELGQVS